MYYLSKVHIDSQHKKGMDSDSDGMVSSTSYHTGVCVDERMGIFLLRRNRGGANYCTHVQYCPNGRPPVMKCQINSCQQVMDTAARSDLQGYICTHLQSVPFLPKRVPQQVLTSDSLDFLVHNIKLLKPARRDECLQYQAAAIAAGVSMIVQLPSENYTSSRYLNFSVWDKDGRKKWWSFCGRVCVTYDTEKFIWYCKHVKGSQSCIHKTVAKWFMAEANQFPEHLMRSTPQEVDNDDDCDSNEDVCGASDTDAPDEDLTPSNQYPPHGKMAEEMTKYILGNKKIPPTLPTSLTSGAMSYPKW